jgi:hypothetical protein
MFLFSWLPMYIAPVLQSIPLLCFLTSNSKLRFLGSGLPVPAGNGGIGIGSLTVRFVSNLFLV